MVEDWRASDIEVLIDDDSSAGAIVTVRINTPAGEVLVMGEIEVFDRELVIAGVHIQSDALKANDAGWAKLRQLVRAVAEKADVDVVIIKGAARSTGSRIGRVPGHIRFTRAVRPTC